MIPIQARVRNFEPPVIQKVAPKTHNTKQFRPSIHRNHRIMLSDLRLGTYRPGGGLAIVNLALIGTPIEKTILPWTSRGDSGGSGSTRHYAKMQWGASTNSTINARSSIL